MSMSMILGKILRRLLSNYCGSSPLRARQVSFNGAWVTLLKDQDLVSGQRSLAANSSQFFDSAQQQNVWDYFIFVIYHVHVDGSVIHANVSEHCSVVATMAGQRNDDFRLVIPN